MSTTAEPTPTPITQSQESLRVADPFKARMLLMWGGMFGLHRVYLDQLPEAFIYLSTFGVFLLGVFYDTFFLNEAVRNYNDKQLGEEEDNKKYKNGKIMPILSRMVQFSLPRFVASVLYASWLGMLCWLAGSVTFGKTAQDSLIMITSMAAAVTAGTYLVGNCGGQSRDLVYMWIASFSVTFMMCKVFDGNVIRTLLLASLAATLLGNRSARLRRAGSKTFNWRHYVFWSSLFALLLCVIAVGGSRHILDRRVSASVVGDSSVTSSVGSLLYDRFSNPQRVYSFFEGDPILEYRKTAKSGRKKTDSWWDVDIVGRAPAWADLAAVVVVDVLRAESMVIHKKGFKEEPLRWAFWRMYLVVNLDAPTFVDDKQLVALCRRWKKDKSQADAKLTERERKEKEGYFEKNIIRACQVLGS